MPSCGYTISEANWTENSEELSDIRFEVFVEEQGFAREIELDGCDPDCTHAVARLDGGAAVGTARMLPDGHIGRVAVRKPWRGQGIGTALTEKLIELARLRSYPAVELTSQIHAIPFYERLGFLPEGPVFDEAGAPHQLMVRRLREIDS